MSPLGPLDGCGAARAPCASGLPKCQGPLPVTPGDGAWGRVPEGRGDMRRTLRPAQAALWPGWLGLPVKMPFRPTQGKAGAHGHTRPAVVCHVQSRPAAGPAQGGGPDQVLVRPRGAGVAAWSAAWPGTVPTCPVPGRRRAQPCWTSTSATCSPRPPAAPPRRASEAWEWPSPPSAHPPSPPPPAPAS